MSATTHGSLKAEIETEYAPVEDDSFVEAADEAVRSGYTGCFLTDPNIMPSC